MKRYLCQTCSTTAYQVCANILPRWRFEKQCFNNSNWKQLAMDSAMGSRKFKAHSMTSEKHSLFHDFPGLENIFRNSMIPGFPWPYAPCGQCMFTLSVRLIKCRLIGHGIVSQIRHLRGATRQKAFWHERGSDWLAFGARKDLICSFRN